jgi:dephospho-CoA kinase
MLVSITGEAGSGKDTFCNMLIEEMQDLCPKAVIRRIAFATRLKEGLSKITGIPLQEFYNNKDKYIDEYGMTIRQLMQKFGDITRSTFGDDLYVRAAIMQLNDWNHDIVIFTDTRDKIEMGWLVENGAITFRIKNNRVSKMSHKSETDMDNMEYMYTIQNDTSLDDLRSEAKKYAKIIADTWKERHSC